MYPNGTSRGGGAKEREQARGGEQRTRGSQLDTSRQVSNSFPREGMIEKKMKQHPKKHAFPYRCRKHHCKTVVGVEADMQTCQTQRCEQSDARLLVFQQPAKQNTTDRQTVIQRTLNHTFTKIRKTSDIEQNQVVSNSNDILSRTCSS